MDGNRGNARLRQLGVQGQPLLSLPSIMIATPLTEATMQHYEDACRTCEVTVTLTRQQHAQAKLLLHYDKRKNGNRGRVLLQDLPGTLLLRGDRLESAAGFPDPGEFEQVESFPARFHFWRRSAETRARHRCPLLSIPGVTSLTVALGLLYTCSVPRSRR